MPYPIGKYKGINHWKFKGDNITIGSIHIWLVKNFGRASICEQCGMLNAKIYDWSLLKGFKYERKRENFWMLCRKCHRNYDGTWNKGLKGIHLSPKTEFKKGHIAPKTAFKKGQPSAFKGKHHTAESNEKNRLAHLKLHQKLN